MDGQGTETTVQLPLLTRAATVVPGTLNEEARTVDVIWTTGARVLRGYYEQYYEELSLLPKHVRMKRLNNGAPLLDDHDAYTGATGVIGVVEPKSAKLEEARGIATVRFAKAEDDEEADKIFRKVKDGILQNISVGYNAYKLEETGEKVGGIPVYLVTDWEPYELSVTPMGADDGAGFRSANKDNDRGRTPCVFVTRSAATVTTHKEKKMDPDETTTTTTDPAVAATRAAAAQRMEDAKALAAARQQAGDEAIAAERERAQGIRDIAKRSKLGDAWANKLINAGTTVDKARAAAFDHVLAEDSEVSIDGTLRIGAGDDERDKWVRGASAWLIERTGKRSLLEAAKKKAPELFEGVDLSGGGQFRGLSPLDLARESLERQGVKTRGLHRMEMLGRAFTYRSGSYQTTSDFAVLLESVLHKLLLGAYATQETTWQRFCGTDDVPDFRPSNRYRTGSLPSLPIVAEHGEYKNGVIPDGSKFQISTERHGEIFSLSREAIINDDMGALANLAAEFGRAAARTIENDVYALLALNGGLGPTMADTNPFFHASRANIGTGTALSAVGFDTDRVTMRAQKDPSGRDFLSLTPAVLLVPDSLNGQAGVINDSQYDPDTVANKAQMKPNMVRGMYRDIVSSPRLAASSTRRYSFADPSIAAALIVAFLEGYGRGPIMESKEGWRTDGVEWRVTQYAKAQVFDPKGAVTNAGV